MVSSCDLVSKEKGDSCTLQVEAPFDVWFDHLLYYVYIGFECWSVREDAHHNQITKACHVLSWNSCTLLVVLYFCGGMEPEFQPVPYLLPSFYFGGSLDRLLKTWC